MLHIRAKVLILMLTASSVLWSQEDSTNSKSSKSDKAVEETAPFRLGIHASPNLSFVSSDDPSADGSTKMKFGFGLIAEFNFAKNYSFATGIEYVFRGGEITVNDPDYVVAGANPNGTVKGEYKAGYLQVPLMLKLRTREFGYYTYFVDLGLNGNFKLSETSSISPDAVEESPYSQWGGLQFAIGLGGEYDLGGSTSLLLGLYYNRALINSLKSAAPGQSSDFTYRFDYVNLKLGVLF